MFKHTPFSIDNSIINKIKLKKDRMSIKNLELC